MELLEQLKVELKQHDFSYATREDHDSFLAGHHHKAIILSMMKKIPMRLIPEVFEFIPKEYRNDWAMSVCMGCREDFCD